MRSVSPKASFMRIHAIEQATIRHRPYGGVTSPKARDTIPIIAKWTGSRLADRASGSRIVPTMMIAGVRRAGTDLYIAEKNATRLARGQMG